MLVYSASALACLGLCLASPASGATDPATLRSLMAAARSDLVSLDATMRVERTDGDIATQFPAQTWRVAWSDNGFRVEITTAADAGGGPEDHLTRSYDRLSNTAVFYDGFSTAVVAASPATIKLDALIPEYLGHLGVFPMRTQSGLTNLNNDPLHLLASPRASIVDGTTNVAGVECVVVELARTEEPGATALLRGHYAPSLGYAQLRMQSLRPNGSVLSQWDTHTWIDRGESSVALPLSGTYTEFGTDERAVRNIQFQILNDAAGVPLLHTQVSPSFGVELPAGTVVVNQDTGEETVVAAADQSPKGPDAVAMAGSTLDGGSGDRWSALSVPGAVAAVVVAVLGGGLLIRRWRARQLHARSVEAPVVG